MSVCGSCGGMVGRDCFNPAECAAITRDMGANDYYARIEAEYHAQLEADYLASLEPSSRSPLGAIGQDTCPVHAGTPEPCPVCESLIAGGQ